MMSQGASAVLINDALDGEHRTALSRSNRRFASTFNRLVYTQIWEDPEVDMAAMDIRADHRIATICSAGCNALSYLTRSPKDVFAVDLNFAHLALADMKRAAFEGCDEYGALESMFVHAKGKQNADIYKDFIAPRLSPSARTYWEGGRFGRRHKSFERGFYKSGLLGQAVSICRVLAKLRGVRLEEALALNDADAQRAWVRKNIRPIFEGRLLSLFFSLRHPLFMLGIPPHQFNLLCGGNPEKMSSILADRVEQLAGAAKSSENYFLWQAFTHGYGPSNEPALPPYLKRENFTTMRNNIARLHLIQDSLTDFLSEKETQFFDRFVLLDAQDWMDRNAISALWSQITRTARPGARVVFRTAGVESSITSLAHTPSCSSWHRLDSLSDELHHKDRSGIYGGFHVYEFKG